MSISSSRMRIMGLRGVIVRYFNIYGPRMDPAGYGSVMATFLRQALAGDPLTVYGDGLQSRCFTYIDDCVDGTMLAMESPSAEGQVFNIGNATTETTIADLARKVIDASGGRLRRSPTRATSNTSVAGFEDTRRRVPSAARATERLGWTARVGLDEGLQRTLAVLGSRPAPADATACASPLDRHRARRACRALAERVLESVPNRSRCAQW